MTRIYKYPILGPGFQSVLVPETARVLHFGCDPHGALCVWATISMESALTYPKKFYMAMTGEDLPAEVSHADHVGTCVYGRFVVHLFSVPRST